MHFKRKIRTNRKLLWIMLSSLKKYSKVIYDAIRRKPKYKLSETSLERIKDINPVLKKILLEGIKHSPYDFGIPRDGGFRTARRQRELYSRGRTTSELRKKGIKDVKGRPNKKKITWTLKSYHMSGNAFDIYAFVDGKASWDMEYLKPIARHLQKVAKDKYQISLDWGYDLWKKDGAHFQIDEI